MNGPQISRKYSDTVFLGGGTGLSTLLTGMKHYVSPTAVVSMADDGGSTGELRDRYGGLPSGDVRRCLVALADENGDKRLLREVVSHRFQDGGDRELSASTLGQLILEVVEEKVGADRAEGAMAKLFNPQATGTAVVEELMAYRFKREGRLGNHALGNLILKALEETEGSYVGAIEKASEILNIKGTVLPVTTDDARLVASLDDYNIIYRETNIDVPKHDPDRKIMRVKLIPSSPDSREPEIYTGTKEAIENATFIVIGPGDMFTSVLPNLIVKGVPEAIREAKARNRAKVVYVCNLVTKPGETTGFSAKDHVKKVIEHLDGNWPLDYVVCNNTKVSGPVLEAYEKDGRRPVMVEKRRDIFTLGVQLIESDLIGEAETEAQLFRHDPDKTARVLMDIYRNGR